MNTTNTFLTHWYYDLPNFVMAAVMWSLLGRVLLALIFEADSKNYIWRFLVRITDPVVAVFAYVTPKATAPVVLWLFSFVWIFWLRFVLYLAFRIGVTGS